MGGHFDPKSPDKFLKWRVFGVADHLVIKGDQHCEKRGYFIPHFFVQKEGADLESTFAAIIEPYAGTPFIVQSRMTPVDGNDNDALKAVVVSVQTNNGHHDVCFADGRPEKTRELKIENREWKISAEFAYVSVDANGLRQASLTGGTLLKSPDVLLAPAQRERQAKIVKVDYPRRTLWLDAVWPEVCGNESVIEVIGPAAASDPDEGGVHRATQYTAMTVTPEAGQTSIRVRSGADYYLARVREVDADKEIIRCSLGAPFDHEKVPKDWTISNETLTRFWRADWSGGDEFKLTSGSASKDDFGENGGLYVWEYGVNDRVRQAAFASLRRREDGSYELEANTACQVGLAGKAIQISTDNKNFRQLPLKKEGHLAVVEVTESMLGNAGRMWIKTAN
ncbi:MAG: hypothetical protein HY360_21060 [Verrucomicrobia bacterium]|nr:hypothetical protein [Verrucomicrobiota bacterium]